MGWNIAEAARACRLDPQSWANWESGASPRRFEEVAEKISEASRCNLVWLLAGDAAVARSRWFSPLAVVEAPEGQLELALYEATPDLMLVP
jgi:transcriptional regulator with XRE-family HTH domain